METKTLKAPPAWLQGTDSRTVWTSRQVLQWLAGPLWVPGRRWGKGHSTHLCMFPLVVKDWPHTVHLYGLSPECTSMWRSRELAELSDFPQMLHAWSAPPVSVLCCERQ